MNNPPNEFAEVACDPPLHDFGSTVPPTFKTQPPNIGDMGVVTLDGDKFVSRRPLTEVELASAWTEHFARHGIA